MGHPIVMKIYRSRDNNRPSQQFFIYFKVLLHHGTAHVQRAIIMLTGYEREVLMPTTLITWRCLRIRLRSQLAREWQWSQNRSCSINHSFASGLIAFSCALLFPGRQQHVGCALLLFSNWVLGLHLLTCNFCSLLQVLLNSGKQWLYGRHRE